MLPSQPMWQPLAETLYQIHRDLCLLPNSHDLCPALCKCGRRLGKENGCVAWEMRLLDCKFRMQTHPARRCQNQMQSTPVLTRLQQCYMQLPNLNIFTVAFDTHSWLLDCVCDVARLGNNCLSTFDVACRIVIAQLARVL
jgi:hypothetical protein